MLLPVDGHATHISPNTINKAAQSTTLTTAPVHSLYMQCKKHYTKMVTMKSIIYRKPQSDGGTTCRSSFNLNSAASLSPPTFFLSLCRVFLSVTMAPCFLQPVALSQIYGLSLCLQHGSTHNNVTLFLQDAIRYLLVNCRDNWFLLVF